MRVPARGIDGPGESAHCCLRDSAARSRAAAATTQGQEMFGTIMRAQVKAGQRDAFIEAMKGRGTAANNPGFLSAEIGFEDKDPNRVIAVIHFRDRESYMANADRPQTDSEYRDMLQYLAGPPEWTDLHYVAFEGEALTAAAMAGTA